MFMKKGALIIFLFAFATSLYSQPITHSSDIKEQTIVLYGANYAAVFETREVELQRGLNRIIINGLPDLYDQSNLEVFLSGYQIEYTAPNPYINFENYYKQLIGETITLQNNSESITGKVEGFQSGTLVLIDEQGRRQLISAVHNYRIILPDSVDSPFHSVFPSVLVHVEQAGKQEVELFYVHNQMGWTAEHRMLVNEETGLLSWTTLGFIHNRTSQSFKNTRYVLISGEMNLIGGGGYPSPVMMRSMAAESAMDSDFMAQTEEFSDFYKYTFQSESVLSSGGSLQFSILNKNEVPFVKRYEHSISLHGSNRQNLKPEIAWYVETDEDGLGVTIPAGKVRVTNRDDDGMMILGEQSIGFITPGDELKIRTGRASDISIEEVRNTQTVQNQGYTDYEVTYKIRNNREKPFSLDLRYQRPANSEILEQTLEPVVKGNLNTYIVELNPESDSEFNIKIRIFQRRN